MATRPSKLIVMMNSQSRGPDGLPMKTGPSLAVRGALARVNEIAACHRNVTQKTCNCHLPVITVPPDCHPYAMEQHPMRPRPIAALRSEEHTSELQSLMRISYTVFCLIKKNN